MRNGMVLIIIGAIVAALVVAVIFYTTRDAGQKDVLGEPNGLNLTSTDSPRTTSTSTTVVETAKQTNEDRDETDTSGSKSKKFKPQIELTPYTVYIGFATTIAPEQSPPEEVVSEAVVGYSWETMPNSPHVSKVILPAWDGSQDASYTVHVWQNQSYKPFGTFASGEEIQFPRDGLNGAYRFKVTGIDPDLKICPSDRSFEWGITFTFESPIGLIRTPLTTKLSQGVMCQPR